MAHFPTGTAGESSVFFASQLAWHIGRSWVVFFYFLKGDEALPSSAEGAAA